MVLCSAGVSFGQIASTNKPAAARAQTDIRAVILKLEDANNAARLRGDGKVLSSLYADDFAGVNAVGGKTDKANIVDFYSNDGSVLSVNSTDDVSVRVMTNVALVTARLKYQYNDKMKDREVSWLKYTRVYEKRGTNWMVVAEHFCFTSEPK